jgi:hypothetical protein
VLCSRCGKHCATLSNEHSFEARLGVRDLIIRRELELKCLMCGEALGREWTDKSGYHVHICRKCRPSVFRQYRRNELSC